MWLENGDNLNLLPPPRVIVRFFFFYIILQRLLRGCIELIKLNCLPRSSRSFYQSEYLRDDDIKHVVSTLPEKLQFLHLSICAELRLSSEKIVNFP